MYSQIKAIIVINTEDTMQQREKDTAIEKIIQIRTQLENRISNWEVDNLYDNGYVTGYNEAVGDFFTEMKMWIEYSN